MHDAIDLSMPSCLVENIPMSVVEAVNVFVLSQGACSDASGDEERLLYSRWRGGFVPNRQVIIERVDDLLSEDR